MVDVNSSAELNSQKASGSTSSQLQPHRENYKEMYSLRRSVMQPSRLPASSKSKLNQVRESGSSYHARVHTDRVQSDTGASAQETIIPDLSGETKGSENYTPFSIKPARSDYDSYTLIMVRRLLARVGLVKLIGNDLPSVGPIQLAYLQIGEPAPVLGFWVQQAESKSRLVRIKKRLVRALRGLATGKLIGEPNEYYTGSDAQPKSDMARSNNVQIAALGGVVAIAVLSVALVVTQTGFIEAPRWYMNAAYTDPEFVQQISPARHNISVDAENSGAQGISRADFNPVQPVTNVTFIGEIVQIPASASNVVTYQISDHALSSTQLVSERLRQVNEVSEFTKNASPVTITASANKGALSWLAGGGEIAQVVNAPVATSARGLTTSTTRPRASGLHAGLIAGSSSYTSSEDANRENTSQHGSVSGNQSRSSRWQQLDFGKIIVWIDSSAVDSALKDSARTLPRVNDESALEATYNFRTAEQLYVPPTSITTDVDTETADHAARKSNDSSRVVSNYSLPFVADNSLPIYHIDATMSISDVLQKLVTMDMDLTEPDKLQLIITGKSPATDVALAWLNRRFGELSSKLR